MLVLKIGGNELDDPGFVNQLGTLVLHLLKEKEAPLVIVHGGGRAIAGLQEQLGLKPVKVDGLRVTDLASLNVAQMVLSGQSNKLIVKALVSAGVDALGLSGVDGGLLRCRKKQTAAVDLGYVGEIVDVRRDLLDSLLALGITLVLSPISLGYDGLTYNVNADEAAAAVALAVAAQELTFISNVPGVLQHGRVIPEITAAQTEDLIAAGVITGGMIPKVRAALDAVEKGIPRTRIVNITDLLADGGTAIVSGTA